MKKLVALLCVTSILSACVSTNKIAFDSKNLSSIQGQTVTTSVRVKPDFAAFTPGKALFGAIGASLMVSEGNALVQQHNVMDPSAEVASDLVQFLTRSKGAIATSASVQLKGNDVAELATAAQGKAKVLVDVQTVNWSVAYYPTAWTSYRVIYSVKASIIDVDKKTILSEGFCAKVQDDKANAPSYDDLFANQAAILKLTLNKYAKECSQQLIAEMFP